MLTNKTIKFVKSLQLKKFRKQEGLFFVEGGKSVEELLEGDFSVKQVFVTKEFLEGKEQFRETCGLEPEVVKEADLLRMGTFKTNNAALAVAEMRSARNTDLPTDEFVLALDGVRDPGNLGTIIRIADWYGISKIVASEDTADFYNPKVLNSSMGSFARVRVDYRDLESLFENTDLPVYGAVLDGNDIHAERFGKGGLVLMGNESNGVRDNLRQYISHPVTIPRFGGAESLNVATATAVICDNIRRA
ncbi:RNA methyltransferase [Fulvitalea axinellae]|uniref:RNA methyltransferase n=1 Tax=Fulvitalea axinellae TaxID=1182444 RepID=A0AAU9CMS0_9BACT|nr:RNA methyltransferase [Fulvitalea axinellae]